MYVCMSGPLVSEGKARVGMPCLSRGKPAEKDWECPSRRRRRRRAKPPVLERMED